MSTKKFAAQTFAWLRLLKGDHDTTALAVGVQLTEHFNEAEGGVARAGCKFMADALGMAESTVVRALHRMHARGRIRVQWGTPGRGHPNHIWMVVKPAAAQVLEAGKPAPEENKTCSSAGEPLLNHTPGGAAKAAPSRREREIETLTRSTPSIRGGAECAPELEGKQAVLPTSRVPSLREERAWRELRSAWARPWPDDEQADRRAFEMACREVAPEDILDRARAWAQAVEPRFLPSLAKWLAARGWERDPPKRRRQHAKGNRARKESLFNIALAEGGYVEDDDGNMVWGGDDREAVQ